MAYVENLQIDESLPPPVERTLRGTEGKPKAVQCGGDVFLFAPNVSNDNVQCVLDCILFSELAANHKVKARKDNNTMEWYNAYCDVLLHLGWPSMSFTFSQVKTESSSFSVKTAFLKILTDLIAAGYFGTLGGMKVLEDVTNAIDALIRSGSGSKYSSIYSHCHNQARKNSFSIGIVNQDPNHDTPIMSLFAFEMKVEITDITVLWVKYNTISADLRSGKNQVILNKNLFKQLQPAVEKKLGDKLKRYIDDISL